MVTPCCSVVTLITYVRSFPGMYSHVSSQVTFVREMFVTYITREFPYILMYSHVDIEGAFYREFLVTYLTDEWFLTGMLSCVNNQVSIRYPPPITRITFEGSLVCMRHQMVSESTTPCCSVVALVTFVRSISGMFTHVTCERIFIL